ncbi:MAG: ParB/RepB/Spo0J family partition protein [Cypionkella sp.]|uniref:ParB/RepB/Spo0J family partition protein n=1 Tax=Cypionkella sp. TaxID=2811411 RepID=UPI0027237424|nr:ParB/RepB/Spo0J family partition protein [Cypionkella sp.]MDO8327900.1 ParB/RepB/Spo0J family partition protein [Cypionkella sp.]
MAKRRRLEAPGAAELADLEAGFAAKPVPDRIGLGAPIAQIAGEIARAAEPLDTDKRVSIARDSVDAEAWRLAQSEGRVVSELPLTAILLDHMMRDRMVADPDEIDELKASIRMNGLRLPIEVVALAQGQYGLISGWRRVTAMQQLQAEDPAAYASIKAFIRAGHEAGALYTAMVEENELRAQITPYERGRIAGMAARLGAFADTETAIETIFAAASKAKRSKIRSFAAVHEALGDDLRFPTDLSERNGLRLAHALREGYGAPLQQALIATKRQDAAQEWAVLEPIVARAEAVERLPSRGGRPRRQAMSPAPAAVALPKGIQLERVRHADGYAIRLHGPAITAEMVDQLIAALHLRLAG